jgi:hypothetical protein
MKINKENKLRAPEEGYYSKKSNGHSSRYRILLILIKVDVINKNAVNVKR